MKSTSTTKEAELIEQKILELKPLFGKDLENRLPGLYRMIAAAGNLLRNGAAAKRASEELALELDEVEIGIKKAAAELLGANGDGVRAPKIDVLEALGNGQDGDSDLCVDMLRDRFCFDHAAGRWHRWRDHYWEEDCAGESLEALREIVLVYKSEAENQARIRREAAIAGKGTEEKTAQKLEALLLKRIRELQRYRYKRDILILAAAGKNSLGITGEEWDRNPWLLPVKNGVVELKAGTFRPGKPGDFLKTVAPTEWNSEAKAPAWNDFLWSIFNEDPDLVAYLQRLLGYAITGLRTEHILPILWGKGRNGKGTLLETLAGVLGPLAGPVKAELLLEQGRVRSSAAPDSDMMALRGRRLAWASETDEGRKLNAGKVKWLVGGDSLVGRPPYGRREITWTPTHSLFLLTNHRPKANPLDFALWERIHLIPFALSFVDDPRGPSERKRDPDIGEKLKAEAPGILTWLVEGCRIWQKRGLDPPEVVKAATREYRQEEDDIGRFIDEIAVVADFARVQASKLYGKYEEWAKENGIEALSGRFFSRYIREQYEAKRGSGGVVFYHGLGLREENN